MELNELRTIIQNHGLGEIQTEDSADGTCTFGCEDCIACHSTCVAKTE